jgi:hypothetical protein
MVSFQTKNPNLGKFWRALDGKTLIHFRAIWNILRMFGIFYAHLVHFVIILYIFSGFGIMYLQKSGNTVWKFKKHTNRRSIYFLVAITIQKQYIPT